MGQRYEIKVRGYLDAGWSEWFGEVQIGYPEAGVTQPSGRVADQAALHGLLERIRDLNLTLLSVHGCQI